MYRNSSLTVVAAGKSFKERYISVFCAMLPDFCVVCTGLSLLPSLFYVTGKVRP